jgi:single-stranded-DNA-specific exonuclease
MTNSIQWLAPTPIELPDWLLSTVRQFLAASSDQNQGLHVAQLLWRRGLQTPHTLLSFLDAQHYQSTPALAFGPELKQAVTRLQQAQHNQEKVTILGDSDPDGFTATAVLWDGLSELFQPHQQLTYRIHQRWQDGSELADLDHQLLIVCNLSCVNGTGWPWVQTRGSDVILIDVHRLLYERPPVAALLNPHTLPPDHPFSTLPAVALAYKLLEALYDALPQVSQRPLTRLLDLVALGLLADRVQLTGEGRYLAQRGIAVLQQNQDPIDPPRPGVAKLLQWCRRSGDRPTDISFGLAPRIRTFSQLQAEAQSCVELLTSQDEERCDQLAREAELANARRKALQRTVAQQVRERLDALDLSTTAAIVLADDQWPPGILGFVAAQIAQEYDRPTLLLTMNSAASGNAVPLAYGVARSAQPLNFYELLQPLAHLLHQLEGQAQAIDLSLPAENLPLLTDALNQQLRLQPPEPQLNRTADLEVTVADLGQSLFQELKLLEPCGLGNPVPRLLIRNGWFVSAWHRKIQDLTGRKLEYLKTEFELRDQSCTTGFPGVWWGHYKDELPPGRCDVIVELDFNSYEDTRQSRRYEIRLIAVRPHQVNAQETESTAIQIVDQRTHIRTHKEDMLPDPALVIHQCPSSWAEFQHWCQQADQTQHPLVLAYALPEQPAPMHCWQRFLELAQSLSQTGQLATANHLQQTLHLGSQSLELGWQALSALGFCIAVQPQGWQITGQAQPTTLEAHAAIAAFLQAIQEEQFMQQYFVQAPLSVLQAAASASAQPKF